MPNVHVVLARLDGKFYPTSSNSANHLPNLQCIPSCGGITHTPHNSLEIGFEG